MMPTCVLSSEIASDEVCGWLLFRRYAELLVYIEVIGSKEAHIICVIHFKLICTYAPKLCLIDIEWYKFLNWIELISIKNFTNKLRNGPSSRNLLFTEPFLYFSHCLIFKSSSTDEFGDNDAQNNKKLENSYLWRVNAKTCRIINYLVSIHFACCFQYKIIYLSENPSFQKCHCAQNATTLTYRCTSN